MHCVYGVLFEMGVCEIEWHHWRLYGLRSIGVDEHETDIVRLSTANSSAVSIESLSTWSLQYKQILIWFFDVFLTKYSSNANADCRCKVLLFDCDNDSKADSTAASDDDESWWRNDDIWFTNHCNKEWCFAIVDDDDDDFRRVIVVCCVVLKMKTIHDFNYSSLSLFCCSAFSSSWGSFSKMNIIARRSILNAAKLLAPKKFRCYFFF